ncbi:hypothetical protein ABES03_17335 [Neobacillus rhizosphaerae]|uniref:hypothetical protein n=1 Tax=Neobacillus rhizosphaerae TaxID=2880965 RepID=UPI003D29F569
MRKYKKTIWGSSFLLCVLIISLLYPLYGPSDFDKVFFLYDDKGDLVGVPPLPPSSYYLLGTDRNGESILLMLLYGAKFTILIALSVTILRVVVGGILGIIFSLWLKPLLLVIKDYLLVYKIVPPIIITLVLMGRVSFYMEDAIYGIILYQIVVLAIVGIPSVIVTTSEIIEELSKKSFILTSYLMGGSHFHVLKRQIKPFLTSYGILIGIQQLLNTFILIMYLGIYKIYIGGISKGNVRGLETFNSNSKEWAGLIGQNFDEFYRAPYLVYIPLICYFILILIVTMIKKELEETMNINSLGFKLKNKKIKKDQQKQDQGKTTIVASDFLLQREMN